MHVIAAKAVCFKEALSNDFKEYTKAVIQKTASPKLQFYKKTAWRLKILKNSQKNPYIKGRFLNNEIIFNSQ